jgi:hypothetical protein
MSVNRRHILLLTGSGLLAEIFGASLPGETGPNSFDVDRLLDSNRVEPSRIAVTRYVANATITLFSIPLVSKSSVGSGYAVVEEAGNTLAIQFGAGSWPASARGLNRLGFIQEAVTEERPGYPAECAWLAFMTTSQEKNLDQAKKAVDTSSGMVPYSASQGCGRNGSFASRVERLEFPGRYTWRDITQLVGRAREAMADGVGEQHEVMTPGTEHGTRQPATFLYVVRRAMLDAGARTTACLVFNSKQFQLDTQKEEDAEAGAHFSSRQLVRPSGSVTRMDAVLTEKRTGERTPFHLWYEAGAEQKPPLRFEYQAKSFLRLTFEADAKAETPFIQFAFKTSKEIA